MKLLEYSRLFLWKSWTWLRDDYIKYYTDTAEFTQEQSEKWFADLATASHLCVWGVSYEDQPVGACGLKLSADGKQAEYWGYIGEKELYGQGLGSKMMDLVETKAKEKRLEALCLKVLPDNERAIRLYAKKNYVEYDRDERFIYMKKIL